MKKMLCMIVSLLLLTACFAAGAEDAVWDFDYDDYKITGCRISGDVTVPEMIGGCTVDILAMYLFNGDASLTSLTLPSTLRQIEDSAVSFCDQLTELIIPEGVQVIGDNCFIGNPSLTEVTLPATLRYIGAGSFGSNSSLSKITFLGECPVFAGAAFDWIADDAVIRVPDDQYGLYADALAQAQCSAMIVPSGADAIVYDRITDASLFEFDPATGTIISYLGFDACAEIPGEIDGAAVKAIGEEAFAGHRYLCCLTLPEGLERIGASAFAWCNLLHIDFPSSLRTIEERAFYAGYQGYALALPAAETIGDEAFAQCICISDPVYLPQGLRTIGNSAFYCCSWLGEVYIPASVERIGEKAFADTGLNYLVFQGRTLPEMADNALENCQYLADIDLNTGAAKQDMLAMQAMVDALGLECRVWRMQNPDVNYIEDGLDTYENGVMTGYTGSQTHIRPWDVYEEYHVTAIADGVFKGNQTIEYFAVPYNDVFTHIGAEAFAGSSLRVIDLFDSVTFIGSGAFRDCVNLEEIVIPESVTQVGAGALAGCTNLSRLTVLCDPAVLPADLLEGCSADLTVWASASASDEQLKILSRIAGRAWNQPVVRLGESLPAVQPMPFEPLPGEDFWYDADFARLDNYNGFERNLILPREIEGTALTMLGGSVMQRAAWGDNYDMELPVVSVVIPESYTEIVPYAFANCETLETVICYAPIDLLPDFAFSNCTGLREVIFVNSVGAIGEYVFDHCPNLETVYIGPYTEKISEKAFLDAEGQPVWAKDQCITDPAQLPDIPGLLEKVKADPMAAPAHDAPPAPLPVGEEGQPFLGIWKGIEIQMEGQSLLLAENDMIMMLVLLEDGRMIVTDEEMDFSDLSVFDGAEAPGWRVEKGIAIGDGCTMELLADGRLLLEEGGIRMIFERMGDVLQKGADAPAETDAPSAQGGRTEVKYICVSASMTGITLDAAMLGGEYSLFFHENGTADFVVGGAQMPVIPWEKLDNGHFMIDYFGAKMEIIWTENGFDMNYFDTMMMHFAPEK